MEDNLFSNVSYCSSKSSSRLNARRRSDRAVDQKLNRDNSATARSNSGMSERETRLHAAGGFSKERARTGNPRRAGCVSCHQGRFDRDEAPSRDRYR